MTPAVFAELRALGFSTGVRRYPEQTFHYARGRLGLYVIGVVHAGGLARAFVAFEHMTDGRAGYMTAAPGDIVATVRAAISDLAEGRPIPVGFYGRSRPLQVRFPAGS